VSGRRRDRHRAGVPSDESLLIYKQFTKRFEGMRPRSLLIDTLRMVAQHSDMGRTWRRSGYHLRFLRIAGCAYLQGFG